MAKKMTKTQNGATKVKAEVVKFNPALDCLNGFTDDELVNSIQNKTMKAAVIQYRNQVNAGERSAWGVAKACSRMKADVRQEFETDEALAAFLGLSSKSAFSKLSRLGALADKATKLHIGTAVASELLVLAGDKYGKLNPADHLEAVKDMTKDEAREYVKGFKLALEDKQDKQDESGEGEQDEQGEQSESSTEREEEIHWMAMVRVREEVLAGMPDDVYTGFVDALHKLCTDYELCIDDFWCGADR